MSCFSEGSGSNMLAFSLTQCAFESPLTWLLAGRVCCCRLCGVRAVKGTLPTCSTSSGTKCELQVVPGAMFVLESPLLIPVVSQTCFEMPFFPLLPCESPVTDKGVLQSPSLGRRVMVSLCQSPCKNACGDGILHHEPCQ